MKRFAVFLTLVLFVMLGAACNPTGPQAVAIQTAPQSWIDAPLDGSTVHPPNPITPIDVISHSSDPFGIVQVELSVNGAVAKTDLNADTTQTLVTMKQQWQPPAPGNYTLMVRAQNTGGVWGDYAQAVVTVGGATATPIPTLARGTSTPAPAPAAPTPRPGTPTPLPPVTISFTADQTTLVAGQCTTIRWQVTNASQVFLDNAPVAASGSQRDCPSQTTTHVLGVTTLDNQPVRRTLAITVVSPTRTFTPIPPTGTAPPLGCAGTPIISSFSASPSTIPAGGSATLSWGAVTNADAVEIDQGIGGVGTPGSVVVSPGVTTVDTLTARCKGVSATARTVVTVLPAPTPTPTLFIPPLFSVTSTPGR